MLIIFPSGWLRNWEQTLLFNNIWRIALKLKSTSRGGGLAFWNSILTSRGGGNLCVVDIQRLGLRGPDRKTALHLFDCPPPQHPLSSFHFHCFPSREIFSLPAPLFPLLRCSGWGQNPSSQLCRQETAISWIAMWQPDGAPGIWKVCVKERKRFQYFDWNTDGIP